MLTCRELADFMADYLSGELPEDARRRFDHHLSLCPNCVNYLESYRTTVELGRRAFEDDDRAVPPEVPEDLVKAVLSARRRENR